MAETNWAPYPGRESVPHLIDEGELSDSDRSARIIGVGAVADFSSNGDSARRSSQSLTISEFVRLSNGRHVTLHGDRGVTIGVPRGSLIPGLTPEDVAASVLTAVLPDDDNSGDKHPWSWLAELANAGGSMSQPTSSRNCPTGWS